MLNRIIRFCLDNKLVVVLILVVVIAWGLMTAPFDWNLGGLPRDPVPVDAIPDIGENQQIVFTEWMGRSPQDIDDQITYPLTVSLLGIPGVKTIRSSSMFGLSSIYIIFDEDKEFYWTRSRVLEKLNSLPSGSLPEGVQPALGPDATALGQVFWYTLEGRDEKGEPTGGWDLHELRKIQDWYVRYGLLSAGGVSEVASIGGFVQEYQVDVDPDAMRAHGVRLDEVVRAVRMSNIDVGARSIEVNKVEYFIRGIGFVKRVEDLESAVIKVSDSVPIYVKNVANVHLGPALRRGVLDKEGAEVVGGVVVVRYGENPLAAIKNVKDKIAELAPGLPRKTLANGTVSQVTIVPFYDRSGLIYETLGTLNEAISLEILVTILVVLIMVRHLASSLLISGLLPLAVLMTFIAMKLFRIDANIVALSGIVIAIGTMVDMGIVICENILRRLQEAGVSGDRAQAKEVIYKATAEVGGAVLTAVLTTVVSFLPIFTMIAAEGKLFKPLAFTKTFALLAAVTVALTIIPPLAHLLFTKRVARQQHGERKAKHGGNTWILVAFVTLLLTGAWLPLGPEKGFILNLLFVVVVIGGVIWFFRAFEARYANMLRWALRHKRTFLALPAGIAVIGTLAWSSLGKEFMPPLDEGSFLYMPSTMPHASIGASYDAMRKQDMAIAQIPEVALAVGKLGRVDSSLDPAPISMVETIINYYPEYLADRGGRRLRFKFDRSETDNFQKPDGTPVLAPDGEPYRVRGHFARDDGGRLIPSRRGRPFRLWRPALDPDLNEGRSAWAGIQSPDDIWEEIRKAAQVPGSTSAPKLQPIETRLLMLQTGMRAPMGLKIKGPDLKTIEQTGIELERALREVPSIRSETVNADRIVGKPYLEIDIDREAIARYGIMLQQVQEFIEVAVGGKRITTTVEGRERYPVRVRYLRELRDQIESLDRILIAAPGGVQIPLGQIATVRYEAGPQMIKSEDTFLVGYVTFDMKPGFAEGDVVVHARAHLEQKIASGELVIPAGVSYRFAGSFENQERAEKTLFVVVPLALFIILLILYFQFRSFATSALIFSGIFVAWAGGFIMIWLYGQTWFMDFSIAGVNLRELFQIHDINLSVAIWVGFLALFGIASDNGVILAAILDQGFQSHELTSIEATRDQVVIGAERRIRPALMTSATTILALLPVLTSTGRGSDIMIPMAIPSFGGMAVSLITVFVVPVLYCAIKERQLTSGRRDG